MNLASEKQIAKALAHQLGFAYVNLAENPPDATVVVLIPKDVSIKRVCIATGLEKNLLTVAMADPLLFSLVQDLEFQTGYRIKQVVATAAEILEAIQKSYPDKALAKAAAAPGLVQHAQPKGGTGEPLAETSLTRRSEDDVFEPVAGLKERSETAPIVD